MHPRHEFMAYLSWTVITVILLCPILYPIQGKGRYDWMGTDKFDKIEARIRAVDATNCRSKSKEELTLPKTLLSDVPVYNQLLSRTWFKNRTTLIHIHNMALNRAFFYSYILQRMNTTQTFKMQPNWMYFYFSATADVNANPNMLNGSGIYFDTNCHYPNWYTTIPFNKTLPLFGPRAFRQDNWRNQGNFLREPTRNVAEVRDLGAGIDRNYTRLAHKANPWYSNWLPDKTGEMDSLTKFSYNIGLKFSDKSGSFRTENYEAFSFFGPASPTADEKDEKKLPVVFTAPYFDCGHSDKWIVSAVAPVVDFMPRYSSFVHLRRSRFVATVAMDTDFQEIDFNPCGLSVGNPGPNYLAGIHRCKSKSSCEHQDSMGFQRGSYRCVCEGGTHYPWYVDPPFRGVEIEASTEKEYESDFKCIPTQHQQVMPIFDSTETVEVEGGDSFFVSGGLNVRKRRALNETGTEKTKNPQNTENGTLAWLTRDKSTQTMSKIEMADFASKLRDMKREDLEALHKDIFMKIPPNPQDVEEEHAVKNDVDWVVERKYQNDLRIHGKLKKTLVVNGRMEGPEKALNIMQTNAKIIRNKHIERFHSERGNTRSGRRKRSSAFDQRSFDRMMKIIRQKNSVTGANCHNQPSHRLLLPGDTAYGVHKQFEPEGRTALRLAHFLSAYLQLTSPDDNFGNLRGGGRIHSDQIFAEVIANVMGNFRVYAAGVYFDRDRFENQDGSTKDLFGPFAFRKAGAYYSYDSAGLKTSYVDSDWFQRAKTRYGMNFSGTKSFTCRPWLRSDSEGTSRVKHEYYPIRYRTAPYENGFWPAPYFRCDGDVNTWLVRYVVPFFGLDAFKKLQFRGVTTVEVPLDLLEINQCPQPFSVPNAFKNTARCDYFSTTCSPQAGFNFRRGAYRCDCRLGFEYWSEDGKEWFEGSYVEGEYERKRKGLFNRFDNLYCRPGSASRQDISVITEVLMLLFVYIFL